MMSGGPVSIGQLPAGKITVADVAHLARPHQVIKGPQGLFNGRVVVGHMLLVKIDIVSTQAAQACLNGVHNISPRGTATELTLAHGVGKLAGNHQLTTIVDLDGPPQILFRQAVGALDICTVKKVNPSFYCGINHISGSLQVTTAPEVITAKANH